MTPFTAANGLPLGTSVAGIPAFLPGRRIGPPVVDGGVEFRPDQHGQRGDVGRTVTVTAQVTKVITGRSFGLTGDDSLLVLSAPGINAERDNQITVTGAVRKLTYGAYFRTTTSALRSRVGTSTPTSSWCPPAPFRPVSGPRRGCGRSDVYRAC